MERARPGPASGFLTLLADGRSPIERRVLVLAAHPDDEVIGLGGQFPRLKDLTVVHLTDGAPRDMRDAAEHGFASREAYAEARAAEARRAWAAAGVDPRALCLGFADQEASLHLAQASLALACVLAEARPDCIVTHAYEGGHPDHDSAAFVARAAVDRLPASHRPEVVEMAGYHGCGGAPTIGSFLPVAGTEEVVLDLGPAALAAKGSMLACFATQARVLAPFQEQQQERYRLAPRYIFVLPPHEGTLWYERFDWGMQGPRWRSLAAAALDTLERLPT